MVGARHLLLAALALLVARPAAAESDTVRIAQLYGLVYLPSYVAIEQHLIEQHAQAAGLGVVTVAVKRVSSGPVANDMLLSDSVDLAMGGYGPMLTLWDKTHGAL